MDDSDKKPIVYLLELTCSPGLGFSLASAYLETYARHVGDLGRHYEFQRGLAYTGLGPEGIASTIDAVLARGGKPAVIAFTLYFWNRAATLREIRRLKQLWPDVFIMVGGNDVAGTGDDAFNHLPEVDAVCAGEGERIFAGLLETLAENGREGLSPAIGSSLYVAGGTVVVPLGQKIEDLAEIPSPFLTGVVTAGEISAASMVVMETNRGCPFTCAFCYWGGAINSRVRRFPADRMRQEIEMVVAAMRPGATLFLADANFGMHAQDMAFARLLVEILARTEKRILIFVNWAKNTTARVVETAEIMFRGNLIGSVTLSAQSLDAATLEACRRNNIPFAQYEQLQTAFAARGIPTYTELLLGLPPESADQFRRGLNRVLETGGHPVVYPLLLLNNTEFATPDMRQRWGLRVRVLPYQPNNPDAAVDVVTGHMGLSEEEWIESMELVLVMAVFLHALAGETIRRACNHARCDQVVGLGRLQSALQRGEIGWPADAQALFDNHRAAMLEPWLHDQPAIDAILGNSVIPDHLHYQAIIHVIVAWLFLATANFDALLNDVTTAILERAPTPAEAAACVRPQEAQLKALVALVTGTTSEEDHDLAEFRNFPIDALLLGIYHGAVRINARRPAEPVLA